MSVYDNRELERCLEEIPDILAAMEREILGIKYANVGDGYTKTLHLEELCDDVKEKILKLKESFSLLETDDMLELSK